MSSTDESDFEGYNEGDLGVYLHRNIVESSDIEVEEIHTSDLTDSHHSDDSNNGNLLLQDEGADPGEQADNEDSDDGVPIARAEEDSDDEVPLARLIEDDVPLARLVQPRERWERETRPVNLQGFTQGVGPNHDLEYDDRALDFFYLMFDEDQFETIAGETNRYAISKKEAKRRTKPTWNDPTWYATDAEEVKAFFGLNILMGIHRLPQYWCYWASDEYLHVEAVAQVMSRTRYLFHLGFLSSDLCLYSGCKFI